MFDPTKTGPILTFILFYLHDEFFAKITLHNDIDAEDFNENDSKSDALVITLLVIAVAVLTLLMSDNLN